MNGITISEIKDGRVVREFTLHDGLTVVCSDIVNGRAGTVVIIKDDRDVLTRMKELRMSKVS